MLNKLFSYDLGTILLYSFIVVFSTLLAKVAKKEVVCDVRRGMIRTYDKYCYFLCFVFVAFFAATNGVGADKSSYANAFATSSFDRILTGSEPGYELFMCLLKLAIHGNSAIFISLFGLLTTINVFLGIWKLRDRISIPWAIFIFTSQYYFQSYNLMRMYFAVSILILFAHYIFEGKYIKYAIAIFVASTFHYSMLFVLLAYVMAFILNELLKVNFGPKSFALSGLSILFSNVVVKKIINLLRFSNPIIYKYSEYLYNVSLSNVGLKWIFNVIPFVFTLILLRNIYKRNILISITVSYYLFTLVISLLSYSVPVIGRATTGLNLPILVILPMAIESFRFMIMKTGINYVYVSIGRKKVKFSYNFMKWAMFVYFILAFYIYLSGYMGIDMIDNYKFIWR